MVQVLLYEPSFRRLEAQLSRLPSSFEPVLMAADATLTLRGETVTSADIGPQVCWLNTDVFSGPTRDYVVAALKSPDMRWMQSGGAGFDHPVFTQMIDKGVRLTNSHAPAVAMSEYVLAEVLDHYQRGPERRRAQAEGRWARHPFRELGGSRWLIIGFGAIGEETAKRAKAFGAHVTGVRRSDGPSDHADAMIKPDALKDALPEADVVVVCVPLTRQTADMVDADFLSRMKPDGAVLVNVGRGGLVDETALLAALDRGTPGFAILDVFRTEPLPGDSPFWTHPRVSLSPHAAGIGSRLTERGDDLFVENLRRFLSDEPLLNEVGPREVRASAGLS